MVLVDNLKCVCVRSVVVPIPEDWLNDELPQETSSRTKGTEQNATVLEVLASRLCLSQVESNRALFFSVWKTRRCASVLGVTIAAHAQ